MCDSSITINGQPTEPTLCTSRTASVVVYTFWPMSGTHANLQRYFSLTNFPETTATKLPVLMQMNGYGGDSKARGLALAVPV